MNDTNISSFPNTTELEKKKPAKALQNLEIFYIRFFLPILFLSSFYCR